MDKKNLIVVVVIVLAVCCCVTMSTIGLVYYASRMATNSTTTPNIKTPGDDDTIEAPTPSVGQKKISTLLDTFDSNQNEWNTDKSEGEFSTFNEYIKDGKLYFDVTAKKPVLVKDTLWSQTIYNFDLSVDSAQVSGPDDADSAIVFRKLDNDNYYLFSVCPGKQEYDLAVKKNGEWTEVLDWKKSMNINSDGNNTLRVVANGNKIGLYVNSTLLVEKTDDTINEGGEVGLAMDLYAAQDHGVFSFDNFNLLVK